MILCNSLVNPHTKNVFSRVFDGFIRLIELLTWIKCTNVRKNADKYWLSVLNLNILAKFKLCGQIWCFRPNMIFSTKFEGFFLLPNWIYFADFDFFNEIQYLLLPTLNFATKLDFFPAKFEISSAKFVKSKTPLRTFYASKIW